jgi:three-Cys-motif partner protein
MSRFWGDDSWRKIAYKEEETLFGKTEVKEESLVIVDAYCRRLKTVAGFPHVAKPLPMRNTRGAIVYYLLFASQKLVAKNILEDIFRKYERQGMR